VPKIISSRCELVKLCHINRSGPGFFLRHSVVTVRRVCVFYQLKTASKCTQTYHFGDKIIFYEELAQPPPLHPTLLGAYGVSPPCWNSKYATVYETYWYVLAPFRSHCNALRMWRLSYTALHCAIGSNFFGWLLKFSWMSHGVTFKSHLKVTLIWPDIYQLQKSEKVCEVQK